MEPNVSQVSFLFDVPKISALNECFSPEFLIQGAPWKIRLYKYRKDNEHRLTFSLICASKIRSMDWSHVAYASVELLSFGGKNAPKKYSSPFVFNRSVTNWDRELLKWNDLFDATKNYVKSDAISLKIKIIVANPLDKNKSQLIFEEFTTATAKGRRLVLTVTDIGNLMAVCSPQFIFNQAPWFIDVYKDHKDQICVRLKCRNFDEPEYFADVNMSVKLVAAGRQGKSIEKFATKKMKYNHNFAIKSLASRCDLLKRHNGFINNNNNDNCKSIVIEVHLDINQPPGLDAVNANNPPAQRFELECAICLLRFEGQNVSFTSCGHMFCTECIEETIKNNRKACPVCNTRITKAQLKRVHLPL